MKQIIILVFSITSFFACNKNKEDKIVPSSQKIDPLNNVSGTKSIYIVFYNYSDTLKYKNFNISYGVTDKGYEGYYPYGRIYINDTLIKIDGLFLRGREIDLQPSYYQSPKIVNVKASYRLYIKEAHREMDLILLKDVKSMTNYKFTVPQ